MFHIASSTSSPKFPDYLSENVKNFLSKCFIRNPKLRPNATELLNDIWFHQENDLFSKEKIFPTSPYSSSHHYLFNMRFETNEEYVEHNKSIIEFTDDLNLKEKFMKEKNDPKKDLTLM